MYAVVVTFETKLQFVIRNVFACCHSDHSDDCIALSRGSYSRLPEEGIIVNAIGMTLIALSILMVYILQRDEFRFRAHILIRSGDL